MSNSLESKARDAFARAFGTKATISARAPGRVELLGNHTDYNGGLVLAAAIDRQTFIVGNSIEGPGRVARICSVNLDQCETLKLDELSPDSPGSWARYVAGVLWSLEQARGRLPAGFNAEILGDIPLGAGLSSSASVQVAMALFALQIHAGREPVSLDDPARMALAKLTQYAENHFVGVNAGLLDPFTCLFGDEAGAVTLDCRSVTYERLPLGNPPPAIVVCDSGTARRLADGMYNQRRSECEQVVKYFRDRQTGDQPPIESLRDVSVADVNAHWDHLDPKVRLRARHVLSENERVSSGAEALRQGDLNRFGSLMLESHRSSRDDFENSSPALDALIDAAAQSPGFLGGKLSGAGWAGCTVNLVVAEHADAFAQATHDAYRRSTGLEPTIHVCKPAAGASVRCTAN